MWSTADPSIIAASSTDRPTANPAARRRRGTTDSRGVGSAGLGARRGAVATHDQCRMPGDVMQRIGDHSRSARRVGSIRSATRRPRRRRTPVVVPLFGRRGASNAAHEAHGLHRAAHAGQLGRAFARAGLGAELLLDDPVLTGVVREHRDPAARHDGLDRRVDRRRQHIELAVDLDTDRLERALGWMTTGAPGRCGDRAGHDRGQLASSSRSGGRRRWRGRSATRSARRRTCGSPRRNSASE